MSKLNQLFHFALVTLVLAALAPSAWAAKPTEVTVVVPEVVGATAELFAFDAKGGWQAVASDKVPSNAAVRVVWTADTGKGLTAEGAVGVFQWQATLDPVVGGEHVPAPTVSEAGDSEVAIAIDTRERIVVGSPEEVLPIWYAAGGEVQEKREGDEQWSSLVKNAEKAGTLCWTPTDLGLYTLTHPGFEASLIIYSQPFPLSITQPKEGGSFVAITNGVEATGTFEVLGFENVTIAAKPAEHWQLKEMVALTNDVEVMLKKDRASITNQFEMPCYETVVTGAFVIAESYRAELLQAATNRYLATSNNLEKLRMHRLSEAETDAAIAAARLGLDLAVAGLLKETTPTAGEDRTNRLAIAFTALEAIAQQVSDAKPTDFVIADDFSGAPFEDYDEATGTFTWNGQVWTNGVNAFTSFTDAFTNETYGAFATNLHVFGVQTIAMEPPMVDPWNLDLVTLAPDGGDMIPAIVSVDPTKSDPSELINITNKLSAIKGEGEIILGKTDAPTTIYDKFIAEGQASGKIIVKNCGVEPSKNPNNNCSQIYVGDEAGTETTDEGETFVLLPGVEDLTGGIMIGVYPYATNDVKVAGRLEAPNGVVSIMNNSTNKLTLAGTVHGRRVGVYNTGRDGDVEGVIDAVSIVSDGDVEIQNNAHLEANVVAGGKISIQNGNINTLVGTYKGSTIELLGNDPGALSNATFVSTGAVAMFGNNVLTGPFTIEAPSVDNSGYLAFSVANDNHTTWLNDFDLVGGGDFCVVVDEEQTDGEVSGAYVIASNATTAVGMTFSLEGGSVSESIEVADGTDAAAVEAKTLYIGAKAYSLVVDANGALVFEVKWGKFAITYDAMGPYFAGETTVVSDSYVHAGYSLPADPIREGYVFDGWYDGVTNGAPVATAGASLLYIKEHALFARWQANGGVPAAALALATDGTLTPAGDVGNNLVLPDTIDGKPVLSIGKAAFAAANYKASAITNLVTGCYLREIAPGAFNQLSTLKTLTISEARDFDDPTNHVAVTIGKRAFAGTRIESLEIAADTVVGEQAFRGCAYLKEIAFFGDACNPSLTADAFTLCGYANGTGKIKLYMSDAFQTANADFVSALKNGYAASNVEIADLSGYSPATSVSIDGLEVSQPTEMTLTVAADALIAGTFADVSSIRVLYRERLSDAEREYVPTSVVRNADGTYTVKFTAPNDGRSGFMRVIVK